MMVVTSDLLQSKLVRCRRGDTGVDYTARATRRDVPHTEKGGSPITDPLRTSTGASAGHPPMRFISTAFRT